MRALQNVKQSGFETTLLVDPVDDFAVRRVAGDGFAQELADTRIVIGCYRIEQLTQFAFEHLPRQVILIGGHDHRMRSRRDVIADQQLFIELLARTQASELNGDIALRVSLGANTQTRQMNHFFPPILRS